MSKSESKAIIPSEIIKQSIYIIRSHKVILDKDLAMLYGVETKNLNKAVSRNLERFPEDFVFQLTKEEWDSLRFQIGTSDVGRRGGRRYLPFAFTEHGVAMASNILRSNRAIEVSIQIIRTFIRLRQTLITHKELTKEMTQLKAFTLKHSHANNKEFKRIWEAIEKLSIPPDKNRMIGFDLS